MRPVPARWEILSGRLLAVARMAKRLVILPDIKPAFAPGNDVVNIRGRLDPAPVQTSNAKRIRLDERYPVAFPPSSAVTPPRRARSMVVLGLYDIRVFVRSDPDWHGFPFKLGGRVAFPVCRWPWIQVDPLMVGALTSKG